MKIISVVGARPNFIKIAPFIREINNYNDQLGLDDLGKKIEHILVHTGQHYDSRMSKDFFDLLNIPTPDINMEIGSGTHAQQVGKTMIEFEKILQIERPDWVVVVGDVNATLACSITAKKEHIKVCHIEAGIRSGDLNMPEEINRIITDRISDLLLTPDKIAVTNLLNEGVASEKIKFVGNIMIDSLDYYLDDALKLDISEILEKNSINSVVPNGFYKEPFAVVTMHRPSNVDSAETLLNIINFFLEDVGKKIKLIWPIHPRTMKKLNNSGAIELIKRSEKILLLHPVNYFEMLFLTKNASLVLTDSGGIQEESTIFGTPCLTLRENTERPSTLSTNGGTSFLTGNNILKLREHFNEIQSQEKSPFRPELWDGSTAKRCLKELMNY